MGQPYPVGFNPFIPLTTGMGPVAPYSQTYPASQRPPVESFGVETDAPPLQ